MRRARVAERQLRTEIVKSGTWLYDGLVPTETWIVKQNFEFHYEEGFEDGPETLNEDGECFRVVTARNGTKIGSGEETLTLAEAVVAAEQTAPGIVWDDHLLVELYGGRWHHRRADERLT
jgi:hypothetical protein